MSHRHSAACWTRYTECGEHHAHDYNCGGGELGPGCPIYVRDILAALRGRAERIENDAKQLGRKLVSARENIKRHQFARAYNLPADIKADVARVRAAVEPCDDVDLDVHEAFERIIQYLMERA